MAQKLTLDILDDAQKELSYRVSNLEKSLKLLLGGTGLTLVVIVGASYWLGHKLATVETTVTTSSQKVDTLHQVVYTNADSLVKTTALMNADLKVVRTDVNDLKVARGKVTSKIIPAPDRPQ